MPTSPPRGLSAAPSRRGERFAPGEDGQREDAPGFGDIEVEPLWKRLSLFSGSAEVFDEHEAEQYYVELQVAMGIFCEALDKVITKTTADGTEAYIWRVLRDEEMLGPIAESWVTLGRQRKEAAQAARQAVVVASHYEAGIVTAERLIATFLHYQKHGFTLWIPFLPNLKALRFGSAARSSS